MMAYYKKIFWLIIILMILAIILSYIKGIMLYHPAPANAEKYEKFYQRLLQLAESRSYLLNFIVPTSDGIFLDAVYIKNPETNKCIIFFHGNAGNISMRYDMIKFLYNYASIIVFDYRSFGKSTGTNALLSATDLEKDAKAIWDYAVTNLKIKPNNISFFGESLGCAVAISLAAALSKNMESYYYPHSIICNAPFNSLGTMIEATFNKINLDLVGKVLGFFLGSEYKSDELIKYINHQTKILLAHSPRDEIIPYSEGRRLFTTISQLHPHVKFINITGTHNNLGLTDQYIYALADLFND